MGGLGAESAKVLYHHPVYNLPVYAHQPLTHAATPSKKAVTTYAKKENVHFSSIMCQVDHREVAKLWDFVDLNTDGLIGFNDMDFASRHPIIGETFLGIMMPEVTRRSVYETDGEDIAEIVGYQLKGQVQSLFHKCDSNNDNILDMDEFYQFAHLMYDAADFYHIAARNALSDGGNELANLSPPNKIPKSFGVITQEEWDCTQNPAGTGLEPENCPLDNSQTRIETMVGNNGDSELTLWEYFDVFAHFYKKAKASVHFDDYCKNYVPYDTSDFVGSKK